MASSVVAERPRALRRPVQGRWGGDRAAGLRWVKPGWEPVHRRVPFRRASSVSVPSLISVGSALDVVPPGVLWLKAEDPPGAVNGEQRAERPDVTRERHVQEDLGEQVSRGPVHHRVGRRDDERGLQSHRLSAGLQREPAG